MKFPSLFIMEQSRLCLYCSWCHDDDCYALLSVFISLHYLEVCFLGVIMDWERAERETVALVK